MQEKTFVFNKKSHIWIYGHGFLGVPLFERLSEQGYSVKGFIDRNAKTLQKEKNYMVVDPDRLDEVKKDDVIVLTFQNIQEHEKAASELQNKGYKRIIYLYENTKYYPQTFDDFNALVYGDKEVEFVFPETGPKEKEQKEAGYVHKYGDYVVFEAPVQIVLSAPLEAPFAFAEKSSMDFSRYNYPLGAILEYDALFSMYLYGKCEHPYLNRYLSRLKGNARTAEEFLQGRLALCDRMMREFSQNGIRFFRNAPSHVELDTKRKTLMLTDGHHRAAFLNNMQQNTVPVRLDKYSYELWKNDKEVYAVKDLMRKNNITLYTPILHPGFTDADSVTENRGNLNAKALAKFFLHIDLPQYSVLDYNANISYYSRIFFRLGAKEVASFESRTCLSELASAINRLEGCNSIRVTEERPDRKFDIVLCMNDMIPEIESNLDLFDNAVAEMDKRCNKFLVIKVNYDGGKAENRILKMTSFSKSVCLNVVVENGQRKEVLVFERL